MPQTSITKLLNKRCCSHKCPRSDAVPAKQPSVCGGCKDAYYCDRQCQKDGWPLHKALCQRQRNQRGENSSVNGDDLDPQLPSSSRLSEIALLKTFLSLHRHSLTDAALACIAAQGGSKTFDFRGNVMFVVFRYRRLDDNPGTALSFVAAECLPISKLYQELPIIEESLKVTEDNYNSIAEFNHATRSDFAGLLRIVYWAEGNVVTKHLGITSDPRGPLTDSEGWQSHLQFLIDNGLVGKEVDGGTFQAGKIVKRGSQWKWVPLSS